MHGKFGVQGRQLAQQSAHHFSEFGKLNPLKAWHRLLGPHRPMA
jgi:hypothetical protein